MIGGCKPFNRVWLPRIAAVGFVLLGCLLLYQASPYSQGSSRDVAALSADEVTTVSRSTIAQPLKRKIEDIRVGQRVWADNPEVETSPETAVNPATWKLLRLRAETVWDDGTVDDINIETLQSPEWIELCDAQVGSSVPIPLDLVEMGLPEDLMAKVLAIERCPPIEDSPGRVVLTTVNHLNRNAFAATVEDANGRQVTTRPTGFHKFYRATDGAWVSVVDLQVGDQLRDAAGRSVRVAGMKRLPGTHRVYNMTVEGEHVYHVSTLGLLAHNNGCSVSTRPDFYVRSTGEVIPSTGYRHVSSNAAYLEELVRTGRISENAKGTYFSFDRFDDASIAAGRMQVPHDAAIRVEFDTQQILGDIDIPRGMWREADYFEPITRDFPKFGVGGATQATTRSAIQARRIVDLRTGRVLYGQ